MPPLKDIYLENKYPAVQYLIYMLYAMSTVSILCGGYIFVKSDEDFAITILVSTMVFSTIMIVIAQILAIIKDMEWNQRESIELSKQQIESIKD